MRGAATMKRVLRDLPTPAFVINRHAFARNCQTILKSAEARTLKLRPHVKTHKTVEGAMIQAGAAIDSSSEGSGSYADSVVGFVASTLPEIRLLVKQAAAEGATIKHHTSPFHDILYGVPICAHKLPALDQMRQDLQNGCIHVIVDNPVHVSHVESYFEQQPAANQNPFSVFLKLDTGYHRAGVPATSQAAVDLAMQIIESPVLTLCGVYSHCGHTYDVSKNDSTQLDQITTTDMEEIQAFLLSLQSNYSDDDESKFCAKNLIVSVGSTPSIFSHTNTIGLPNIVEVHPGNYTLYDRQQQWTGACTDEADIAGRVVARVIGHYPDRNTILLDAGATALTKEGTPQGGMCAVAGSPGLVCSKMSQEVTIVKPPAVTNDDTTVTLPPIDEPIVDEWIPAKGFA